MRRSRHGLIRAGSSNSDHPVCRPLTRGVTAVIAAGAVAAVMFASACSILPGGDDDAGADPPAYEMSKGCPAPSADGELKTTVKQLNSVLAQTDLAYWQAADMGASARLRDDRIVWVFGDTVRRSGIAPNLVANSMLVTSGLCVSQLMATARGPIIPDVKPGVVRWPMSVTVVRQGEEDVIVVFAGRIRRSTGPDVWDFDYLGSDAVTFRVKPGQAPQLDDVLTLTPDRESVEQVNWGSASMISGDYIYVYGTELPDKASFGRSLHVGRGALKSLEDRTTWQFWDGAKWQSDPERSAPVIAAKGGVSQTLSVDDLGQKIVAVSKKDGDLGSTVATWTSDSPVGPWEVSAALDAPFMTGKDEFSYAPLAHPEVPLADGKLLVSISRNTTDLKRLRANPIIGRPRFAEVDRP